MYYEIAFGLLAADILYGITKSQLAFCRCFRYLFSVVLHVYIHSVLNSHSTQCFTFFMAAVTFLLFCYESALKADMAQQQTTDLQQGTARIHSISV